MSFSYISLFTVKRSLRYEESIITIVFCYFFHFEEPDFDFSKCSRFLVVVCFIYIREF